MMRNFRNVAVMTGFVVAIVVYWLCTALGELSHAMAVTAAVTTGYGIWWWIGDRQGRRDHGSFRKYRESVGGA
jgi:hypothetical protein